MSSSGIVTADGIFYYAQAWDVEVAVVYQLVLPRVILHVCIYDACMYV